MGRIGEGEERLPREADPAGVRERGGERGRDGRARAEPELVAVLVERRGVDREIERLGQHVGEGFGHAHPHRVDEGEPARGPDVEAERKRAAGAELEIVDADLPRGQPPPGGCRGGHDRTTVDRDEQSGGALEHGVLPEQEQLAGRRDLRGRHDEMTCAAGPSALSRVSRTPGTSASAAATATASSGRQSALTWGPASIVK